MDKATEMMIFCRSVEEGSFSAAARVLDLTPSADSKQITRLEDRPGVRLLNRTTRRLRMKEEGQVFYERSKVILTDIEDIEQSITASQQTPRGTLRVSASVAFGRSQLVPLLPKFMLQNPSISIDLELTDREINLLEEGIDVAIRIARLDDSSYIARKLADNRRLICAAPSYLAKYGVPQIPDDLLKHNCIRSNDPGSHLNEWEFATPEGHRVIHVSGNFAANLSDTLYEAALAGIGLVRLSTFLIGADIKDGRLVPVLPDYIDDSRSIYAIYPHRRHLSPKVRAFIDFLVTEYTPEPPWETELCRQQRGKKIQPEAVTIV
jgi:DNA-binding transcriptional LysR family regulator